MNQTLTKAEMFFIRNDRNFIVDLDTESNTSDDNLHNNAGNILDVKRTSEKLIKEISFKDKNDMSKDALSRIVGK